MVTLSDLESITAAVSNDPGSQASKHMLHNTGVKKSMAVLRCLQPGHSEKYTGG